ncbi:MAG: hypothetical protein AB7U46_15635 [Paenirhodobacter sp.]|uniref:hypothetical protein n=1 Tax=Paenirhodobacter sp. TaxID=1965326 RepID=UPI003D0D4D29
MKIALVVLWVLATHVVMVVLSRHLVRRRHYPFFVAIRQARGKPASYLHFLLLYYSWLDPATMVASMQRPGFRRDQLLSGLIYGLGFVLSLFLLLIVFSSATASS